MQRQLTLHPGAWRRAASGGWRGLWEHWDIDGLYAPPAVGGAFLNNSVLYARPQLGGAFYDISGLYAPASVAFLRFLACMPRRSTVGGAFLDDFVLYAPTRVAFLKFLAFMPRRSTLSGASQTFLAFMPRQAWRGFLNIMQSTKALLLERKKPVNHRNQQCRQHISHAKLLSKGNVDTYTEDQRRTNKGNVIDQGSAHKVAKQCGKTGDASLIYEQGKGRKKSRPCPGWMQKSARSQSQGLPLRQG